MLGGNCLFARTPGELMVAFFRLNCTRFVTKEAQSKLRYDLGKTSKVEALNTKSSNCAHLLRRQRQSGLVRKSCGVWEGICDDISERFLILLDRHNQQCLSLKPPKKYQKSKLTEMQLSP